MRIGFIHAVIMLFLKDGESGSRGTIFIAPANPDYPNENHNYHDFK